MLAVEPHSRQERAERVSLTTQPAPPPRPHSTMPVFRSKSGLSGRKGYPNGYCEEPARLRDTSTLGAGKSMCLLTKPH